MKKLVLVSESKDYLYFIGKDKRPRYSWYRIKRNNRRTRIKKSI